jgi:hypothetical protein
MIFQNGKAYAICKGCGAEQPVPVKLIEEEIVTKCRIPKLFLGSK